MNVTAKVILFSLLISISLLNFAQETKVKKPLLDGQHKVFASIYTGGYYAFNTNKPNSGFELSSSILGYKFEKSKRLKFTLMYDVTRTTHGFKILDTAGNQLPVSYFEGSKYTAFLKMAEIKWHFADNFSLSAGQLLSEQYLTVQDKYWGKRYTLTSMQELFRMGNPADFGMRVEYRKDKQFAFSLGANNGNGPFRHQDTLSVMEFTSNLELYLIENLILKGYIALTPASDESENELKSTFSGFAAYKNKKFLIGLEYSYTDQPNLSIDEYSGASGFASYYINSKWEIFARYDYVERSPIVQHGNLIISGFQYKPEKHLYLSVNYRHWLPSEIQQVYFNLGAKF